MLFRVPKLFKIFCPVSRWLSGMQGPDIKKYMGSSKCLWQAQSGCYSISGVPVGMESVACISELYQIFNIWLQSIAGGQSEFSVSH